MADIGRLSLTDEQRRIVQHGHGHAVVGAVAGSGKSATLVERVACLLDRGVAPAHVLVVMFNRSAADEFRQRLAMRVGPHSAPEVLTFHGLGLRVCGWLEQAGMIERRHLLTEPGRIAHLARCALAGAAGATNKSVSEGAVEAFLHGVDLLKGAMHQGHSLPPGFPVRAELMAALPIFEQLRRQGRARLYADLIHEPVAAADATGEALALISNRYAHILIDEFQDINEAQVRLIRHLSGGRASVMAVGDDDQTIYTWRGARPEYMVSRFETLFHPVHRYQLSRTFRHGHSICLLANSCIQHNSVRQPKLSVALPGAKTDVRVRMHVDDGCSRIIAEIQDWAQRGGAIGDVAILVREYAPSSRLQVALCAARLPFRLVGSTPFLEQREALAMRGYLALVSGRLHRLDREQIRDRLRAILTCGSLALNQNEMDQVVGFAIRSRAGITKALAQALRKLSVTVAPALSSARQSASTVFQWLSHQHPSDAAAPLLREVIRRTSMLEELRRCSTSSQAADEQCRAIWALLDVVDREALAVDELDTRLESASENCVAETKAVLITSVHRSKGLEWPCVILPDLAEGAFPARGCSIEDERRLFYVAVTRARSRLVLMCPVDHQLVEWSRAGQGGHPEKPVASRFLYEANLEVSARCGEALANGRHPGGQALDHEAVDLLQRYQAALE